ncbi:unnamed protein product (macronuclear) [Paramecium tetraurelia]|uniref:HTH psq-type domain-containing protein n=1 Tax=Paramecium tetraurelia TaxID=5888 RepID=A0D7X9_PARTE|nr:uncharacterized protein GSPATT00014113001 [Paramecium tetraurelia]CAK79146.1 unnamed protein product [Paramecium tetraurelia]|eukprot:XP_001446543.1 hypothetical protein (macronuclear) [Paramecium tetraurelia strain d4-2]
MSEAKQFRNIQNKNCTKDKKKKLASRIEFLKLVLCDNKTIRASAQICKINFSTAKAILNKFRKQGVIKQPHKDYDRQIDLLKQIAQIQEGIKCEQITKTKEFKQKLRHQLQVILQNSQIQRIGAHQQMDIKALEEELRNEKQKEYKLVEQILKEQITLMKSRCH